MTLAEFRLLNEDERYVVWLTKAVKIGAYEKYFATYELYQLDSFYVEIKSNKLLPDNERWAAFTGEKYLEPYLAQIDLSKLGYLKNI